jgi:hypothetical protein
VQHIPLVDVEIDVRIEALTAKVIVRTTAKGVLSAIKSDASEFAHGVQERLRIYVFVEGAVELAYIRDSFNDRFAPNHPKFVRRTLFIENGKSRAAIRIVWQEKIVDGDMAEQLGLLKLK